MTNAMENIWKDLSVWQKEISKKDEALLRSKPVHDKALPAIRQPTELVLDNLKPIGLDSLSARKISTPVKTRTEKAEAEKAKGNEYFGKKDFKNAIVFYGRAIDLDPTVPVYFVNRAMAYLKINKFLEAEKDCTRGIELQPKNVKALWRRGIALRELGRISEAKRDFEMGLSIEPNNKSIMDELKKLPVTTEKPIKIIKSDQKRRLSINVIDQVYSESKLTTPTKLEVKGPKIAENKPSRPTITESKPSMVDTKSGPRITEVKPSVLDIKTAAKTTENKPSVQEKIAPTAPKTTSPMKFICPRTNFEFERDWKTYKGRGDEILYQYFQCIPPTSYATLFKSSLESDQFEKIIEIIEAKELTAQDVFNVLEGLSQVKRIDMLVMFLGKKHQQAIQGLFDMIKTSNIIPTDKLTKVSKVYGACI